MQFKHWFSKTILLLSIQWFRIIILKNQVDKSTIEKVTWITLNKDKCTVSVSTHACVLNCVVNSHSWQVIKFDGQS